MFEGCLGEWNVDTWVHIILILNGRSQAWRKQPNVNLVDRGPKLALTHQTCAPRFFSHQSTPLWMGKDRFGFILCECDRLFLVGPF